MFGAQAFGVASHSNMLHDANPNKSTAAPVSLRARAKMIGQGHFLGIAHESQRAASRRCGKKVD